MSILGERDAFSIKIKRKELRKIKGQELKTTISSSNARLGRLASKKREAMTESAYAKNGFYFNAIPRIGIRL